MSGRTIEDEKALGCWGYVLGDIDKFLEVLHHVVSTPVPLPVPPAVELDQGGQPRRIDGGKAEGGPFGVEPLQLVRPFFVVMLPSFFLRKGRVQWSIVLLYHLK